MKAFLFVIISNNIEAFMKQNKTFYNLLRLSFSPNMKTPDIVLTCNMKTSLIFD